MIDQEIYFFRCEQCKSEFRYSDRRGDSEKPNYCPECGLKITNYYQDRKTTLLKSRV
jgi:hypothetical protein